MYERQIQQLNHFFAFHESIIEEESKARSWIQAVNETPLLCILWNARQSEGLMQDFFMMNTWRALNVSQIRCMALRLTTKTRESTSYVPTTEPFPQTFSATMDSAICVIVREQLTAQRLTDIPKGTFSPFRAQYAARLATSTPALRYAVDLIVQADVLCNEKRRYVYIIAPSTIPNGGLGTIVLGSAPTYNRLPYLGILTSPSVEDDAVHRIWTEDKKVLDGSTVPSIGAAINSAPRGKVACVRLQETSPHQIHAVLRRRVTSSELWADYGYHLSQYDPTHETGDHCFFR